MRYVIRRSEDGWYATPPGYARSYTQSLNHARRFPSREAAQAECCGNEYVEEVT